MNNATKSGLVKLFIRVGLAAAFLSAVADRLGYWPVAAWGNWENFVSYTATLNPWFPISWIPAIAFLATMLEVVLGICLLIGFKLKWSSLASGILLIMFGLSMTWAYGIKAPLDYSVFSAAGAAFGLSLIKERYYEIS